MDKKIDIITIHSIYNYGSALQSYATQCFLQQKGLNANIIDYRPCYDKSLIRKVKNIAIKLLFAKKYIKRYISYKKFRDEYMNLTEKTYTSFEELCKNPPHADIFISGSDQIWNTAFPCGKDNSYKLEFVKSENKISYASSMGRDDMSKEDLESLANILKNYKWVSMREESGVKQLATVNINSTHVSDPVFLLTPEYYKEIMIKPKNIEKYILVYSVHYSEELNKIVDELKRKLKLSVVLVGDFPVKCPHDISKKEVGPREFIGLVNDASFIITNSFHCTAFSIILEKQFISVMPDINVSRISNILQVAGLEIRGIKSVKDLKENIEEIDYCKVTPKIRDYSINSGNKFMEAINKLN